MDLGSRDHHPTLASQDADTLGPDEASLSDLRVAVPLAPGATVGRYVVLARVGQGAMGVVYAAYDPELDRKIAIKLVRDDVGGAEGRARLGREAQALARVHHPNIAAVFDTGSHGDAVFVAMEFVDGETLAAWERRRGGAIPWREAVAVYAQAGRGLAAAHAAGIVHRDFKPHNAMIDRSGRVVVLDFGLARPSTRGPGGTATGETAASTSASLELTATGGLVGTPAYMSPEQLAGEVADAASDQFSFCVALWRAVYGEAPFAGETFAELAASVLHHRLRPPPRGVTVPAAVRDALARGLARESSARHPSMHALLDALQRDRGRAPRRAAAVAVAVTALAAAVWTGQRVAHEDPCAAPAARLEEAWGSARRAAVARALRADAKAHSHEAGARVEQAIDDTTARWWAARNSACSSPDTGAAAVVRTRCLDQQIVRIDAITRVLAGVDVETIDRAPAVLRLLPDPAICDDGDAAHDTAPLPDDAALQEKVEALRARSYDSRALFELGAIDRTLAIATAAHDEARALEFAPLVAETTLGLADAMKQAQRYDEALALFEEAWLAAAAIGHDEVILGAAFGLIFVHTRHTRRFDLAQWMIREADAIGHRFADRPLIPAELALARARLAIARGDPDAGLPAAQQAVALIEALPGEAFATAVAYQTLFQLHLLREDHAAADEALARGAEAAAVALGDRHPLNADFLVGRAQVAASGGRSREAVDLLERAIAIYSGAHGSVGLSVAAAYNGLGLALESDGQPERAAEAFARALEVHRERATDDHPQIPIIAANAGNVLRRLGRTAEAIELHRLAVARHAALAGPEAPPVLAARENLADDLRVVGRCSEAEAEYRAVIELHERVTDRSPGATAYAHVGLALCRLAAGAVDDAIAMLELAVQMHRDTDRGDAEAGIASFALAIAKRRAGRDAAEVDAAVATARRCFASPSGDSTMLRELDRFAAGEAVASPTY